MSWERIWRVMLWRRVRVPLMLSVGRIFRMILRICFDCTRPSPAVEARNGMEAAQTIW